MDARELGDTAVTIEKEERISSVKKGAWSSQEDSLLINYIAINGEGRWNFVALHSGLRRTGKSCRLRWKNYLQPNVRRGNFTLDEQLRIMELHCCYGNRWSKIAGYLPGRTDNEIKNYWRCRVVKQAKQLKYDINGVELREFVRDICLPWLSERIHATLSNNTNTNNVIGNGVVTTNYDVTENTGPEAFEAGRWASWSDITPHEAHEGPSSLGLGDPMLFGVNFGESYYAYDGYGFEGSPGPIWFDYDELSNIYATT